MATSGFGRTEPAGAPPTRFAPQVTTDVETNPMRWNPDGTPRFAVKDGVRCSTRFWPVGTCSSPAWRRFCRSNHLEPSMSRKGNCWDNSVAESFFSSLKKERIKKHIYKTRELAEKDVADYIDGFYNPRRRHGHVGGVSPDQFDSRPGRATVHRSRSWIRRGDAAGRRCARSVRPCRTRTATRGYFRPTDPRSRLRTALRARLRSSACPTAGDIRWGSTSSWSSNRGPSRLRCPGHPSRTRSSSRG